MSPTELLSHVRHEPFRPFRLVLTNGAVHNIHHPDQCMVMPKALVVGETTDPDGGLIEWTITLKYWLVARVEPLPAVSEVIAASA